MQLESSTYHVLHQHWVSRCGCLTVGPMAGTQWPQESRLHRRVFVLLWSLGRCSRHPPQGKHNFQGEKIHWSISTSNIPASFLFPRGNDSLFRASTSVVHGAGEWGHDELRCAATYSTQASSTLRFSPCCHIPFLLIHSSPQSSLVLIHLHSTLHHLVE